jgi:hypothetical protein
VGEKNCCPCPFGGKCDPASRLSGKVRAKAPSTVVLMAGDEQCLRCGQALVVHGSFSTKGRLGFRSEELKLFSLSLQFPEVSLTAKPTACAACGLVWAELDPAVLRQKLHDLGNEHVRRRLGLLNAE